MRKLTTILLSFLFHLGVSQSIISFNDHWHFSKGADTTNQNWKPVQVPHTWNANDPFDKEPGYYRGISWYKKQFNVEIEGKRLFLVFEGVNQETNVFVNGKLAGSHLGGYTAFNVEITDFIQKGRNDLAVKVNNKHDERVPPLKGDFNFYGGIYRDVWLHSLDEVHFELSEYGDQGIFITTPKVSEDQATVSVRTNITNQSTGKQKVEIVHSLFDDNGRLVSQVSQNKTLQVGRNAIELTLPEINQPALWYPENPVLYRLESEIKTKDGDVLDVQNNPVGFRWFRFDANEGFFLNGKYLKLMGTNRHQDYEGFGNALSDDRHIKDVTQIKEMGSNFFRTAHYPQDPSVITAADQLGLVVSMEIPLDHEITDSEGFLANSKRMMQEMIRQNFNHPSIFIWAYMNEMMLGRKWERDQEIIEKIRLQAVELEELTREEDPTRYTMIPNHGALDLYIKAGLTEIPMIVGWNLYYGWYEADDEGAGKFLDRFHELVPDKPVLITEYGAGADPRIRSLSPERFDFSIEWQNQFHQSNLIQFTERKFLAGAAIWNIADFGSEGRNDADPKINSKGVLEMDRMPKDAFFLYQTWLRKDPIIKIGSSNWDSRVIRTQDGETPTQPIEVFSNGSEVELFLNEMSLGKKEIQNKLASWDVTFVDGSNQLLAETMIGDKNFHDMKVISVRLLEPNYVGWEEGIHVNCGSTFYFIDEANGISWLPDESYQKGLFGYVGGETYRPRDRGVGSDRTIQNTTLDPVYQTSRIAPSKYTFDTTPGTYEVIFHWAETDKKYQNGEQKRVFDVSINDEKIFAELNIYEDHGFSTAVSKKVKVVVKERRLIIDFLEISGKPMISGIQLRKLN
ncbi:glycoside hydrolase family 2 TIM barrel-domain containing protein [Ekhidna sp.]